MQLTKKTPDSLCHAIRMIEVLTMAMAGKLKKISSSKKKQQRLLILILIAAVAILVAILLVQQTEKNRKREAEISVKSTLEKVVHVSELSTCTSVYNGIAEVRQDENQEQPDYYVAYEAEVKAGIDFEKADVSVDNEAKTVRVKIPDVSINAVKVDIASMDFIFINEKANTSTISEEAYKACEQDVAQESGKQEVILELARQNAINTVMAWFTPLVEQLEDDYTLMVE